MDLECSELIQKIEYPIIILPGQTSNEDTNPIKKKKTAVRFGADEHILVTDLDQDIWEEVDTEEEIEKSEEEDKVKEEEEVEETNYKKYVIIDVGGERHQACLDSFTSYPKTIGQFVEY